MLLTEARNRNPLTLSSAAVTVCEIAGNQPSADVVDKPGIKRTEASVPGTLLIGLDLTFKIRVCSCSVLSTGLTRRWQLGALPIARRCSMRRAPRGTEMKATGLTVALVSSECGAHL